MERQTRTRNKEKFEESDRPNQSVSKARNLYDRFKYVNDTHTCLRLLFTKKEVEWRERKTERRKRQTEEREDS